MPRAKMRTCDGTGITTKESNFYAKQSHLKPVDNLRRNTGATKAQMRRMFNQLADIK